MSSPTARHAAPRAPRPTSRRSTRRAGVVVGVLAGGVLLSTALAPSASAEAEASVQWERTTEPTPDPAPTPLLPESPALVEGPVGTDAAAPDLPAATTAPTRAPRARAARSAPRPQVVRPVSTYRISATFGDSGSRWSSGRHTGLDFAAPYGTPVRAVAAGRVVEAGWDGSYGNAVVVQHSNGAQTRYAHLSADSVRVGEQVAAGEVIGRVGSTGNSTGNHLHLEVITPDGGFADPRDWLRGRGVRV
jgi:murein DD-endopeptidase MepM/ murein hydrolase activator NlpD